MPVQVNAIIWGVGLVVAVGTAIYYFLNAPELTAPHGQRPRPRPRTEPQPPPLVPRSSNCSRSKRKEHLDECIICLENFASSKRLITTLDCGDRFHEHCISMWFAQRKECPLCRQPS